MAKRISKIVLYFCLFFILGIFIASLVNISQHYLLGFLFLGVLLMFSLFFIYKNQFFLIGFFIIFMVLGAVRYQIADLKQQSSILSKLNHQPKKVSLIGKISAESDIRKDYQKIEIAPEKAKGKILATVEKYNQYQYGDRVKVEGKLKSPPSFEGFNYKKYLQKEGIYSVMYYPKIKLMSRKNYKWIGSLAYAKILNFKKGLRRVIQRTIPPPEGAVLSAMILGDKSRMSDSLKQKLNITGLRHVTAISGMHVLILTTVLMALLIGIGFWRGQAFYLTLVIISFFVVMTGFHPSAVRAGIMGSLFVLGQVIGRRTSAFRIIIFTSTAMLFLNPMLLRHDIGFQLSFLAVLGICYLGPAFKKWLKFVPQYNLLKLRDILAMTFSAQIFTLPILIYNFGHLSILSPITNILIIPTVYWIMLTGFLVGIFGLIYYPLGLLAALPCWLFLRYLMKIVNIFSRLPYAYLNFEISWFWIVLYYVVIGYFVFIKQQQSKIPFYLKSFG